MEDPFLLFQTLSYRLHLLHKVSDLNSQRAYMRETGLSLSDGRSLIAIGTLKRMSVKDLAQHSNLNRGQASRAAQALVDKGLVHKQDSVEDARGVVLTLTPAGQEACRKILKVVQKRNEAIFGCLSEKEQEVLSHLVDRLIQHNLTL